MDNIMLSVMSDMTDTHTAEAEGWVINDPLAADWAIDKIRNARGDYTQKEMVVNEKIRQMEEWLNKEKEKANKTVGFFSFKLEQFFDKAEKRKTKTQETINLPSGTLKRKFPAPKLLRDDDKLLVWLKERNLKEFVNVEESPDWGNLKKKLIVSGGNVADENGEIVDGIIVLDQPPVFEVET